MDNKYANLSGIARNEPDVYETTTPSAPAANLPVQEDESSSVQKLNVNTKEAYEKFNKKSLNSDYVDFSDTITNRRKFGYRIEPDIYEWNQDLVESPLERFKRLEAELNSLKTDLTEMDQFATEEDKKQLIDFDPIALSKQVEDLQNKVKSLHLETIGAKIDIDKLNNKAKRDLLMDSLNAMKKDMSKSKAKSGNEAARTQSEASIVFKLFTDLEANDLERANKISELNQRLANLETVFGAGNAAVNDRQISKLCNNIENKSIMGLVENMSNKMGLIEKQSLEQVESRLQAISVRVNQLNDKKSLVEDQEKLNRVNELYAIVSKWKDMSALVPSVVSRLTALNDIHQKAFEFPAMLSRLDAEQESIKQNLNTSNDILKNLEKNFESNLASITKNFDILNEKIKTN